MHSVPESSARPCVRCGLVKTSHGAWREVDGRRGVDVVARMVRWGVVVRARATAAATAVNATVSVVNREVEFAAVGLRLLGLRPWRRHGPRLRRRTGARRRVADCRRCN